MARIPAEELEQLKRDVRLDELVRAQGVELRDRGDDLVAQCPLGSHEDTTPSFVVTPAKNVFHCFGCGAAGSVIDWVMLTRRVSFRRAIELLRGKPDDVETRIADGAHLPMLFNLEMTDQELMDAVAAYYCENYARNPEVLEYTAHRLIGGDDVVRKFRLGFCDRTLGYRLPPRNVREGRELRQRLVNLGILRDTGHEVMLGRLTVPLVDETGHVVSMYGRLIKSSQRSVPHHMYLRGRRTSVFNLEGVRGQQEVIVCEAIIDALTLYGAGFTNVTTAYGVEGFSDELLQVIKEHGTRRVLIAFDRDDAGERGAEKAAERLMAAGLECLRVKCPNGTDINDYARKAQPAAESLGLLVRAAEWMGTAALTTPLQDPEPAEQPAAKGEAAAPLQPEAPAVQDIPTPTALGVTTAAPVPPPDNALAAEILDADEHHFVFGPRKYRVRGLKANTARTVLKVNITVRSPTAFYVDTFDLMLARARSHFVKMTSVELDTDETIIKTDMGAVLDRLDAIQDARMQRLLESPKAQAPVMTDVERAAAMELLEDPRLLDRIVTDLEKVGLVGERTNKLVSYLSAVSRKLDKPLAILIQSRSGAGKSSLMDAVLSLMPEEEVVKYSAMTSQALYYMGETNLQHKILALAEEEGAEKASYALKLLQSEGELTIASTGKDPTTGRHETKEYHVEGPVMVFVTTTEPEVDDEFFNRCLVLSVDESREQTRAIHEAQKARLTQVGIARRNERALVTKLHRNAQRLLRPLAVENPYAKLLKFPDHEMRTRRDFPKYTSLIESLTLLHQNQREHGEVITADGEVVETVITSIEDIALANALSSEILGQSLDELQPQTRRLLGLISALVDGICKADDVQRDEVRLTQRQIREHTGWGNTQLKMHLGRLTERELLIVHRAGPGQRHFYELCYDGHGENGSPVLCGLIDVDAIRSQAGGGRPVAGRGGVGGMSAPRPRGSQAGVNGQTHAAAGL